VICRTGIVDPPLRPNYSLGRRRTCSSSNHYVFECLLAGIPLEAGVLARMTEPSKRSSQIWTFADNYLFRGTPTGMWLALLRALFG
jgi:glucuronate isomerase